MLSIQRHGSSRASPMDEIHNDHHYSGGENDLILSRVYTTSFTCEFDMAHYPFDIQTCSMIFVLQV